MWNLTQYHARRRLAMEREPEVTSASQQPAGARYFCDHRTGMPLPGAPDSVDQQTLHRVRRSLPPGDWTIVDAANGKGEASETLAMIIEIQAPGRVNSRGQPEGVHDQPRR